MLSTMFQFIWPSSFRGGDSNVKDYHTDDGCQVITRAHMDFGKMKRGRHVQFLFLIG
jgi:hypothetical protein